MRFPTLWSTPLLATALCVPLAAQGTPLSLATDGAVGVFAKVGTRTHLAALPGGTRIGPSRTIRASLPGAMAATTAGLSNSRVTVRESGSVVSLSPTLNPSAGTTTATDPRKVVPGPHCFLLTISGNGKGKLTVTFAGKAGTGSKAGVAIDIGKDGKVDFRASADGKEHRQDFPVEVKGKLLVQICTSGLATLPRGARSSSYGTTTTVAFATDGSEPPCKITAFGRACGMKLDGSDRTIGRRHMFAFKGTGAFPLANVALVFGERRVAIRLPGVDCTFYTIPRIVLRLHANLRGEFGVGFPATGPLSGVAYSQAVSWRIFQRHLQVRASNGLMIDCGR